MSAWQLHLNHSVTATTVAAFLGTRVATVESFHAFDLTSKILRFNTTLNCLFVTALRNNLHHRANTETAIRIMTTLLALMVIGAAFPTHLWTSTRYMKFICRMTDLVAGMTTVKTYPTEFVTTTKGKVLKVTAISYFVDIAVPLANQC